MTKKIEIFIFIIIISPFLHSQTSDNLKIMYSLVDSSVSEIIKKIPDTNELFSIKTILPNYFSVFESRAVSKLTGSKIQLNNSSSGSLVVLTIDKAGVKYSEMFRDGFLGDFKVKREIEIGGNYYFSENGAISELEKFIYKSTDTVHYDNLKSLENTSLPFTQGEIPPEPLFSSLIEPVIAISATAVAIILFFTIRSK